MSYQILSICNTKKWVQCSVHVLFIISGCIMQLSEGLKFHGNVCFISQCVCCMSEVVTMYAVSDALTLARAVRGNCSWYVASLVTFMNSFSFVYVSNNQGPSGACCVGTRVKFWLCCSSYANFQPLWHDTNIWTFPTQLSQKALAIILYTAYYNPVLSFQAVMLHRYREQNYNWVIGIIMQWSSCAPSDIYMCSCLCCYITFCWLVSPI